MNEYEVWWGKTDSRLIAHVKGKNFDSAVIQYFQNNPLLAKQYGGLDIVDGKPYLWAKPLYSHNPNEEKLIDEVFVSSRGVLIPWNAMEKMIDIYQDKINTYKELKAPQVKIDYRRGQKAAFEALLSYKEHLIESGE